MKKLKQIVCFFFSQFFQKRSPSRQILKVHLQKIGRINRNFPVSPNAAKTAVSHDMGKINCQFHQKFMDGTKFIPHPIISEACFMGFLPQSKIGAILGRHHGK